MNKVDSFGIATEEERIIKELVECYPLHSHSFLLVQLLKLFKTNVTIGHYMTLGYYLGNAHAQIEIFNNVCEN